MRGTKLPTVASPSDVNVRLARAERDIRMLYRRVWVPYGLYEIKIWADSKQVGKVYGIGQARFVFEIPEDLDGKFLTVARGFVSTAGGTASIVQVRNIDNGDVDMLLSPITIDAGDRSSKVSSTPVEIDEDNAVVQDMDQIALDVDMNPSDSRGLGVILRFE